MRGTPGLVGILTLVVGAGLGRGSGAQDAQQPEGQKETAKQMAPPQPQKAMTPQAAERAQLIGRWKLNQEESENAREKMRESMQKSGGRRPGGGGGGWGGGMAGGMAGGGGRGGGGWGGGRGPGGGPGGGNPEGAGNPRAAIWTLLAAPVEIDVTQLEPEVVLAEPGGQIRKLHPDGKKHKLEATEAEVKTRWDGPKLLTETTTERGGKLIESWNVDPEKRRLIVMLKMERPWGGEPVTVRRIYDPLE